MRSSLVGVLLLASLPAIGHAQLQQYRPPSLEVDGFVGYTAVDADEWAGLPQVSSANHIGFGALLRYMFLNISGARLGIEVGTQQLFSWELESTVGTTVVRRKSTVAGFHFAPMVRVAEGNRGSVDVGFGFHFLGDDGVPGLIVNTNYTILRRQRFTVPIGARVNLVLNDPVSAMNVSFKAGLAMPIGD